MSVVVSVPFGRYRELPTGALSGKIVVDANNYYPQRDGNFPELDDDTTTSSELLQAHLPDARVVKAFNAMKWQRLRDLGRPAGDPDRLGVPISGDDQQAKQTVAELIDQIGFDPVDAGSLAEGGEHQPGSPVYAADLPTAELRSRLLTAGVTPPAKREARSDRGTSHRLRGSGVCAQAASGAPERTARATSRIACTTSPGSRSGMP